MQTRQPIPLLIIGGGDKGEAEAGDGRDDGKLEKNSGESEGD